MLTPYEMSSVVITGPKSVQEDIIKELHNLKILHIVEHSKSDLADIGTPLESANKLSEILIKVRSLISSLNIKKEGKKFELKKGLLEIESTTKKLNNEVNSSLEELRKTEELISRNEAVKQELEILKDIDMPIEALSPYNSLAYFSGYLKGKNSPKILNEQLHEISSKFMLLESNTKKGDFIVLFIEAKNKENASKILQKARLVPVNFLNIIGLRGDASGNLRKVEEDNQKLQKKKEEIKTRIEKLKDEHKSFLLAADEFLSEQLEKAEAPLKFASTPSSFLIKGWVPSDELKNAIGRLNKISKNKVFVHFEPAKKIDKVPVKLKNPKYAKPFEFFLDLYSVPAYKEIDPTFFIFLTFPILFGIMLGDIGYGIVSFILFWVLKKKMPKAKDFFNILMLASFVSILFGIMFGEFFGLEIFHSIVSREHEMFKMMYIAIGIGVVHVNIGLVIGFINELKAHGFKHAFFGKISWFVLESGAIVILLYLLGILSFSLFRIPSIKFPFIGIVPMPILVGMLIIILSLTMLYIGEGVKGPIESLSIITNTLSYTRLMAIGLSSVILAVIVNEQSRELFHKGGFFVLIGILILVIGHAINLMLGLLGSFLHSLRLHYVEFFSKFFHGGAKRYQPFGLKEN